MEREQKTYHLNHKKNDIHLFPWLPRPGGGSGEVNDGNAERVVGVFVCSLHPPTERIGIITSAVMMVIRLIFKVFTLCFHLLLSATVR